jgi:hypothetical protein
MRGVPGEIEADNGAAVKESRAASGFGNTLASSDFRPASDSAHCVDGGSRFEPISTAQRRLALAGSDDRVQPELIGAVT